MNSEEFIAIINEVVRDAAIEETVENLEDPPGRKVSEAEQLRSNWFKNLSEGNREHVVNIIKESVNAAVFGMLTVIDGDRAIEDNNKGKLLLIHKGEDEQLLNDPNNIGLHDLYNAS